MTIISTDTMILICYDFHSRGWTVLDTSQWLKKKVMDYKRFVMTLLIMSTYLYIGTLISLYEYATKAYLFLYPVIGTALLTAFIMTLKIRKWKRQLVED